MSPGRRELPVAARLGGFVAALALVFGATYGVGAVTGDSPAEAAAGVGDAGAGGHAGEDAGGHAGEAAGAGEPSPLLPGLTVSQGGYTLVPESVVLPARAGTPFRFTVTGPDGRPVTRYEREHEKDLHLIVVRRDLTAFQHAHPTLGPDGRWSIPLDLTAAGTYRVFADFVPAGGDDLVLGVDLAVPGAYAPAALPVPDPTAILDGGPDVRFATTFPTAGRYRLSLDLQIGGVVRTAAFTVTVPGTS